MFACAECGCVGVCGCASVCVCCVLGVYVCESVWLFGPQQKGNVYKSLFDTSDLRNLTSTPPSKKRREKKKLLYHQRKQVLTMIKKYGNYYHKWKYADSLVAGKNMLFHPRPSKFPIMLPIPSPPEFKMTRGQFRYRTLERATSIAPIFTA